MWQDFPGELWCRISLSCAHDRNDDRNGKYNCTAKNDYQPVIRVGGFVGPFLLASLLRQILSFGRASGHSKVKTYLVFFMDYRYFGWLKNIRSGKTVPESLDEHDHIPDLLILLLCQPAPPLDQTSHPDDLHTLFLGKYS